MATWSEMVTLLEEFLAGKTNDDVRRQAEAFAYQGFDPEKIIKTMAECQPDARRRTSDIYQLIILFLSRGNKIDKILKKSLTESVREMNDLVRTYRIKSSRPSSNTDITLARITASFPYFTYKITMMMNPTRPSEQWFVSRGFLALPKAFKTPGLFSLLPKDLANTTNNLRVVKCIVICQHAEAEVINSNKESYKRETLESKLMQIIQYGRAAHNNCCTTAPSRLDVFQNLLKGVSEPLVTFYMNIFGVTNDETLATEFLTG